MNIFRIIVYILFLMVLWNISAVCAENLPYYMVKSGVLFEDFESLSGWVTQGGTACLDYNNVKTGYSSLKAVTNTGTVFYATKNIYLTQCTDGVGLWVYVSDPAAISDICIYFSSVTNWSKYFLGQLTNLTNFHAGWNFVCVAKSDWVNTGGESWANPMLKFRLRVAALAGRNAEVYFDSVYYDLRTKPKCLITFDDGYASVYSLAYPCMKSYGFTGTNFIISSYVGNANFMNLDQLQTLYNDGWDLCNHTNTHTYLTLLTKEQQSSEMQICQDFLCNNGFVRNEMYRHFTSPAGKYNSDTLALFAEKGMITARIANKATEGYNFKVKEFTAPYNIRNLVITRYVLPVKVKSYIDTAVDTGQTIVLVFHNIVMTPPTVDSQYGYDNFQEIISYIAEKKDQIDVVTTSEWTKGLKGSLNPPTIQRPIINSPNSVTWRWIDNSEIEEAYRIHYVDALTGQDISVVDVPANTTSWTDDRLLPDTKYSVRVSAYRSDIGESDYSVMASDITPHDMDVITIIPYGDIVKDGVVDLFDLQELTLYWLDSDCNDTSELDLNGDCIVNFYEYSHLAQYWGYRTK